MHSLKEASLNIIIAIVLAVAFIAEKNGAKDITTLLVYGLLFVLNLFFGLMFVFLKGEVNEPNEQSVKSE